MQFSTIFDTLFIVDYPWSAEGKRCLLISHKQTVKQKQTKFQAKNKNKTKKKGGGGRGFFIRSNVQLARKASGSCFSTKMNK